MRQRMVFPYKISFFSFSLLLLILLISGNSQAQCAGEDATLSVCDIANPDNQNIDLFGVLLGTPTPGGVWTDPVQTGALNLTTGVLNVWNIHLSGVYTFTYTVTAPGCTDNTATVTVTVGGYSGIPSPNGSACNDDDHVNLFQFFVGIPPDPHLNGSWHDDDNSGGMNNNILDATIPELGTYHFTYTMPARGDCPAMSSTVTVTIFRAPEPGTPSNIVLCSTADLSGLTNVNLFDQLAGEDANGQWSESGTSELSSPFDPFIDIQNIFNTFGSGEYSFTYTVYPTNPVCDIKSATIKVIIEDPLDFTGAVFTVNSDICENEMAGMTYNATLTQGTVINPAGQYQIVYEIPGTVPPTHNFTGSFVGGVMTIPLNANYFPQVGTYTVTILSIRYLGNLGVCVNIIDATDDLVISPIPKINAATLIIDPVCIGSDVVVELSGTNNLGTGDYEITYDLIGANASTGHVIQISTIAGVTSFTIPAGQLPNSGSTTIKITHIVNLETGCENTSTLAKPFTINPVITLTAVVVINNVCENQPVSVAITGLGSLASVAITYELSGANVASGQNLVLPVASGSANFTIPENLLPNTGTSTFTITSITNDTSQCPLVINALSDNFTINAIPDAPTASNASFCQADNATVADLVPGGAQYSWFASANGGLPLSGSTLLVSGNYYISEVNGAGCNSARTTVSVVVTAVPAPVLNPEGESFCGIDNPTLADLSANTNADNINWFDAAENGNPLPDSTLLVEGATYYGFAVSNSTECVSEQVLAVSVTLQDCDETQYDFFIPDGFSPNGDSVNDVFRIPEIQYLFPDYTLEIYNRYGDLMFKGNIDSPSWDGKNSQSSKLIDGIAANGVYFYIVNFNKDNAPPRQGFLYLNR